MKNITLENPSFRYLEKSFGEWLDVQGYASGTVYNLPLHVRELLHYLESQHLNNIKDLTVQNIYDYYEKLKERSNHRRGGGLSNAHLNKHIQALRKFTQYLRKVGRLQIPEIEIQDEATESSVKWLTVEEIQALFKASHLETLSSGREGAYNFIEQQEAFRSRDRAMLAVFYGCGLRRNEGVNLDVSDIDFDRGLLHVRKGKGYKERFVPISKSSLKHLQEYIYDHRSVLIKQPSGALFLSTYGTRMQGQSLALRLRYMVYKTDRPELIEKEPGLHTLRHSIATHLLKAGMKLESISLFLGHSSLESTQVYTHLEEQT
ncbi:MAG: site-specific tyrosine recombinase XerD [Roseivirga sp.]